MSDELGLLVRELLDASNAAAVPFGATSGTMAVNEGLCRLLRRAVDAIESAAAVPQSWLPIQTAPKDRDVLAWFPDLGHAVARFCEYDDVNNAGGWAIGYDYYDAPPTHWMPLPPPPGV